MTPDDSGLVPALAAVVGAENVLTGGAIEGRLHPRRGAHRHAGDAAGGGAAGHHRRGGGGAPPGRRAPGAGHRPGGGHRPVRRAASRGPTASSCRSSGWPRSSRSTPRTTSRWSSPACTLAQLDEALAPHGLVYPVFPGEYSASLGGNVATNAGGMRAVKYGVTRHQVLGLEAVLPSGRGDPQRRQVREGVDRLRPHPADHRLGGHARPGHRGDAQALPAAAPTRPRCSRRSPRSTRSPRRCPESCAAGSGR